MVLNNYINQIVTYLLDKLIGKYVENFTSRNVQTGLYQGDIKLINLPLKSSVLEDLTELPIKVRVGTIGSVVLRIPYTKLRSLPWAIMLEDIYIIAEPDPLRQLSKEKFQLNQETLRRALLESLENKWNKKIKQQAGLSKAESESWFSYVGSLAYRVLRNIQIEVRNIHIQYEDLISVQQLPFRLGLVIDNLSAKNSDFEWESHKEIDDNSSIVNKLINLKGLGLYLNTNSFDDDDFKQGCDLKSLIEARRSKLDPQSYIIRPIALHGNTKRYSTNLPLGNNQPRIKLEIEMEPLELQFSRSQFRVVTGMMNEFSRYQQQRVHIKSRPTMPVHKNARLWWQFAINENKKTRFTFKETSDKCSLLIDYMKHFQSYLLNRDSKIDEDPVIVEFERSLDLDVIVELREICMFRAELQLKQTQAGSSNNASTTAPTEPSRGWFGYFWGGSNKPEVETKKVPLVTSETTQILEQVLPQDIQQEKEFQRDLNQIIKELDEDAVNFFTRDKIFLVAKFTLPCINIKLIKDDKQHLVELNAQDLSVSFESRPQSSYWCLKTSISQLHLQDTLHQDLIRSISSPSSDHNNRLASTRRKKFFYLAFEKNPSPLNNSDTINNRLFIRSQPLKIVYSPIFVRNIQAFFANIRTSKNIRAAARRHLQEAKDRTSESLKQMLHENTRLISTWQVSLEISAPCILFEESPENCLLLDLGLLRISNCSDELCLDQYFMDNDTESTSKLHKEANKEEEEDSFFTPTSSPQKSPEEGRTVSTENTLKKARNKLSRAQSLTIDNDADNKDLCLLASMGLSSADYVKYSVNMDNMMVLIGSTDQVEWVLSNRQLDLASSRSSRTQLKKMYSKLTLIEPCNFTIDVYKWNGGNSGLADKNYQLPQMKVLLESQLRKLIIALSDKKLIHLKSCLMALLVPPSKNNNQIATNLNDNHNDEEVNLGAVIPSSSTTSRARLRNRTRTISECTGGGVLPNKVLGICARFTLHKFSVQLEMDERPLSELALTKVQVEFKQTAAIHTDSVKFSLDVTLWSLVLADARANLGNGLDFIVASHYDLTNELLHHQQQKSRNIDRPLIKFHLDSSRGNHKGLLSFSDLSIIANQETLSELLHLLTLLDLPGDSSPKVQMPSGAGLIHNLQIDIMSSSLSILLLNIDRTNSSCSKIGLITLQDMSLSVCHSLRTTEARAGLNSVNIFNLCTPDNATPSNDCVVRLSHDHQPVQIMLQSSHSNLPGVYQVSASIPHIIYHHSPMFIFYLEQCLNDFSYYLAKCHHKRSDSITYDNRTIPTTAPTQTNSLLGNIHIDKVKMASPILILPEQSDSQDCMVFYMGDIDIYSNSDDSLSLEFTDAHITSEYLPENQCQQHHITPTNSFTIVESVNFKLNVTRNDLSEINIRTKIDSPLQVRVTKQVYEKILISIDNIVYDEEEEFWQSGQWLDTLDHQNISGSGDDEVPIVVSVNFSKIQFNLYEDETEIKPFILLTLNHMDVDFIRLNKYVKNIDLSIAYLTMNQLNESNSMKPMILSAVDTNFDDSYYQSPTDYHLQRSSSCPDMSHVDELDNISRSLPSYDTIDYRTRNKIKQKKKKAASQTPPCKCEEAKSGVKDNRNLHSNNLVNIKMKLVDKKISNFQQDYDGFNRFIDAQFNELTLHIDIQSWVVLLDFIGMGSRFFDLSELVELQDVSKMVPNMNRKYNGSVEEIINTKITAKLSRANILLNNQVPYDDYPDLASISTVDTYIEIVTKDGNLTIDGAVSDFFLKDLSPTGAVYSSRIFSSSIVEKLCEFRLFKYGLPDPSLLRSEDIQLSVKFSAPIVYVHTQKFLQEINLFIQNFMQYQDRLCEIRVTSAGRSVNKEAPRSSRILLDVSCHAPILLLPVSAFSDFLIVADLGQLSLSNSFDLNDQSVLLDKMIIDLTHMDIYTAQLIPSQYSTDIIDPQIIEFPQIRIKPDMPKPLSHKATLNICVQRNLNSNTCHVVPDWKIDGSLSSIDFTISHDQYRIIRGFLSHNLGENIDFLKSYQYQSFRNEADFNLALNCDYNWLGFAFEMLLNNVTLNLLMPDNPSVVLCSVKFIRTKLGYYSYSNGCTTTQLLSDDLIIEDLRFVDCPANKRANIFQSILSSDWESNMTATNQQNHNHNQVEVTFTTKPSGNTFDVILDKMKSIVIFDWLTLTFHWVFTEIHDVISLNSFNCTDQSVLEYRAKCYLCSKSENVGSLPASETYQSFIKSVFVPTTTTIQAKCSRFFILERAENAHSAALILTVAGQYSYQTREAPEASQFSLKISRMDLASCYSMSSGISSALSIIYPLQIKLYTKSDSPTKSTSPTSLKDTSGLASLLFSSSQYEISSSCYGLSVFIEISAFKIRLSFNDIQLLNSILQRCLSQQTKSNSNILKQVVKHRWSSIDVDESNLVLNSSQTVIKRTISNDNETDNSRNFMKNINKIEFRHIQEETDFVSICLIDDCIDADVPLLDMKLNSTIVKWSLNNSNNNNNSQNVSSLSPSIDENQLFNRINFNSCLSVAFYNTDLFKWTSVINPWHFSLYISYKTNWTLNLKSHETFDMDISSDLLYTTKSTYTKWGKEFAKLANNNDMDIKQKYRQTLDFSPFLLDNQLGCTVKCRRLDLQIPPLYQEAIGIAEGSGSLASDNWIEVSGNSVVPLCFESETTARDKIRYNKKGVHFDYRHRVELKMDGWSKTLPITVDNLGVFYRDINRDNFTNTMDYPDKKIRIVVEIVRQGTAQNKIILRSAILVHNKINVSLQLHLTHKNWPDKTLVIEPCQMLPIPINLIHYTIRVKPCGYVVPAPPDANQLLSSNPRLRECLYDSDNIDLYEPSNEIMSWWTVKTKGVKIDQNLICRYINSSLAVDEDARAIYLISSIEKLNFPETQLRDVVLPGHLITLSASFIIDNRLPCDLSFALTLQRPQEHHQKQRSSKDSSIKSVIRPSRRCYLMNCTNNLTSNLSIQLEAFPRSDPLCIPGDSKYNNDVTLCIYDERDRLLELIANVTSRPKGPIYITIYAPYCILNKTSLPLIFCQSSSADSNQINPSAGYSQDMEMARSPMPFLFSFTNRNESQLLQIRLGKQMGTLQPRWSQKLSIDKPGTTTIQLRAAYSLDSSRPCACYNIGLEVTRGKGIHHKTILVLLTARYILDNRSSYPLNFSQYQCLNLCSDTDNKPIMALPNSVMTFHWPRDDLDPLLAVQLLDADANHVVISRWSGGFFIDNINSFHVYLKGINNYKSTQLRITVVREAAIFRVIFADVFNIPSPYRLENHTKLQIFFRQNIGVESSGHNTIQHHLLLPQTNLAYALDHPTEAAIVTFNIEGGTEASYYLNEKMTRCTSLYYDNFLYLVVIPSTKPTDIDGKSHERMNYHEPLVFDVPQNSKRIVLHQRSPGARSQLWYYSKDHHLFHEGSMAPHHPQQNIDRAQTNQLLLDIAMLAPQPMQLDSSLPPSQYQLILAKADSRRDKFQKWFFTNDGCLVNLHGFKCRIDRYMDGAVVTSGYSNVSSSLEILINMDYLRPGSGKVDVTVTVDGPTRVVKLMDSNNTQSENQKQEMKQNFSSVANQSCISPKFQLNVELGGLGIFLINSNNQYQAEELIYICLQKPKLVWTRQGVIDQLHFTIFKLQVDNQLLDTSFPNVVYEAKNMTSSNSNSSLNKSSIDFTGSNSSVSSGASAINNQKQVRSAFTLSFERETGHPFNVHVLNEVKAGLVAMTVILEERLLLKVIEMLTCLTANSAPFFAKSRQHSNDEERLIDDILFANSYHINTSHSHPEEDRKIYIGQLQLLCGTISLSVIAADNLPHNLSKMKKLIPTLMSFANAQINIEPYHQEHIFETSPLILEALLNHLRTQLRGQAIKIFGTVDFLGNPLGFISDMTSAVKMFYADQNLNNMVRHFAHGIGDSTAKICGTASRIFSDLAMDPAYEQQRQMLFESARRSDSKSAQMVAGFKSLLHGFYGGVKSIPSQSWRGFQDEGASGLILGTVKGLLGVVIKPVGGIFDLATGTATSFREIALSSDEGRPQRQHIPRINPLCSRSASSSQVGSIGRTSSNNDLARGQKFLDKIISSSGGMGGGSSISRSAGNSMASDANGASGTNKLGSVSSSSSITGGMTNASNSTANSSGKVRYVESLVNFVALSNPTASNGSLYKSGTNKDLIEALVTDCAVYLVSTSPSFKILKSYSYSSLAAPPIAISALSSSTISSTSINSDNDNSSAAVFIKFIPQSNSNTFEEITDTASASGALFKCDSLFIADSIVKSVCEAYSDYMECQLTFNII